MVYGWPLSLQDKPPCTVKGGDTDYLDIELGSGEPFVVPGSGDTWLLLLLGCIRFKNTWLRSEKK